MPDPKPNTVAHCNQRIDGHDAVLEELIARVENVEEDYASKGVSNMNVEAFGLQIAELRKKIDEKIDDLPKVAYATTSANVGQNWSATRTSSEDAQKKAVESARQVTKSCLLAAIRDELNADHTSTLRVRNLSQAYADLYGEAS